MIFSTTRTSMRKITFSALTTISLLAVSATVAQAAQCGNTSAGFPAWVQQTKKEAAAQGINGSTLAALDNVTYATATINADRNQKSFKLSLNDFMQKRGSATIIKRGKALKQQNAALLSRIEKRYGVPAGPLLAIWGMETGFGNYLGKQHTLSAVATLAYDCRRSAFFTNELYAALQLIQRGDLNRNAIGAMHGEIGQTQFLPSSVIKYGVDGDGNGHVDMVGSRADALASTANFLRAHGWKAGAGYQEGEPNYAAIKGWNAATVYQQAIAIMGKAIDSN